MSDDPRKLKSVLLDDSSTEEKREFAKMLAEECATADMQAKGHRCWFMMPTVKELETLSKFAQPPNYDKCPKCGKERLVVEVFRGNIGDSWHAVCRWGDKNCDFKEYVSDDI